MKNFVLILATVSAVGLSISFDSSEARAQTFCTPSMSVDQALRAYNQASAAAQDRLQQAYGQARQNLEARKANAEAVRSNAQRAPSSDPDHSGERMNEIQAQYDQEIRSAYTEYGLENQRAIDTYNADIDQAQRAYNEALCVS